MSNDQPNTILITTCASGITTITLNRPARRNALDPSTAQKLYTAFRTFDSDASQKVCVFHGANGTFCAGADLLALSETPSAGPRHFGPVSGENMAPMGPSRLQLSKPVICAVSGYAVAGGLELSLLGDMRVVEEDAVFGVFCRRFGVPLIDGGTVRLQAIVGLGRALDMVLTGRPVGAREALQMGLANRVVAKGRAVEEAMRIAEVLVEFPQLCMRRDRRSLYYAAHEARSLEDALAFEFRNGEEVISEEGVEGAKRFARGAGRKGKL